MTVQPATTLVIGGARSGKSQYAEDLACRWSGERVYIATAEAGDGEMAARIAAHRARRGSGWRTLEEPLELAAAVAGEAAPGRVVVVDCLTLWVANLMAAGRDVSGESERLAGALTAASGPVIAVSNEVGQGIVPDNTMARQFRDHAGLVNQVVAGACANVVAMTAGIGVVIKGSVE